MSTIGAGLRLALRRVGWSTSALALGVAALFSIVVGLLERQAAPLAAPDRTLGGIALGVALPLLSYALVGRATSQRRLTDSVYEVARFGGNRRLAVVGVALACAALAAVAGAALAACAVLVTRLPADPQLVRDLVTSTGIGGLAGSSYALLFTLASTMGRQGGARFWALIGDWLLGAGVTLIAVPWPRSHVLNLLGGPAVLALSQVTSSLLLVVLGTVFLALALWRCPP